MKFLHKYLQAAKNGGWALLKLNWILAWGIPFNRPHGIRILKISEEEVITSIPFKRRNLNHIKGIHACGLATVAEYCSGLLLLNKLNPAYYRLIMQSLEMQYHYQAKSDVHAVFTLSASDFETQIQQPLQSQDIIYTKCTINLFDESQNHVATGITNWQIKSWEKVKTKV